MMKVLLLSGGTHQIILRNTTRKIDIANTEQLQLKDLQDYLSNSNPKIEGALITDEAFSADTSQDIRDLNELMKYLISRLQSGFKVIVVTRDFMKASELDELLRRYENLKLLVCDYIRVPDYIYKQAFEELGESKPAPVTPELPVEKNSEAEKKKSFLDRFRSKPKAEPELKTTDRLTKEMDNVSRSISRVVAITGHRGCGLTSTVANLAWEANKRGLSAIIIDMDIDYRSMNMYFDSFHEKTKKDQDVNASLIRTLARPQDYMTTAFDLKDKLWITALGYSFADKKLTEQLYNSSKLVGLLSVLRNKFNLVILDMPMDLFKPFKEALIHIDVFGLCVPNSLHSVLSTLRNAEVAMDKENASYLNAKSKIIVTKYNDRSRFQNEIFVPERVCELLSSGLSPSFVYEMKLAGYVPYSSEFDTQIETDVPMVNISAEHESAYGNILLRLMEGVK